jgi:uncharacterized protein (DUF3820 family)
MGYLNDKSPMPFGKYANVEMANVPADYLLWLYKNGKGGADVTEYIEDNLEVLKQEIKRN